VYQLWESIKLVGDAPAFPAFPFNQSLAPVLSPYGPEEIKAITVLKDHTKPAEYRPYSASPAMQKAVESLSLNLHVTKAYQASPSAFAASIQGLDHHETQALASRNPHRIHAAMRGVLNWVRIPSGT
jgi:hypothetical protein